MAQIPDALISCKYTPRQRLVPSVDLDCRNHARTKAPLHAVHADHGNIASTYKKTVRLESTTMP